MAYLASNFIDSLVFIYDGDNNLITKTTVTGQGKDEMYIEVTQGLEKIRIGTRLQLLIVHSAGASELNGTLKSVRQGIYEISIYGEHQRVLRTSDRHRLNAVAVISDMVTDSYTESLAEPLPVMIQDISRTGVQIRSRGTRFEMGAILEIEFSVREKSVTIFGEVIREQIHGGDVYSYGCKLCLLE